MRNQALFSSKDKSKKLKGHLLQFLFGALMLKFYFYEGELVHSMFVSLFYKTNTSFQTKTDPKILACHVSDLALIRSDIFEFLECRS